MSLSALAVCHFHFAASCRVESYPQAPRKLPLACANFGPPKLACYYFFYLHSLVSFLTYFFIYFSLILLFFTIAHHFANNFWLLCPAHFVRNAFIYLPNYWHYASVITVIDILPADPQTLVNTTTPLSVTCHILAQTTWSFDTYVELTWFILRCDFLDYLRTKILLLHTFKLKEQTVCLLSYITSYSSSYSKQLHDQSLIQ